MRNIKLILEYDGSLFFGFQRQPKHPTIQEALEKALSKLLNRKTKISAASGRTDSGVHAEAQVVNFKTDSKLPAVQIQKGLNGLLPKFIAVKSVADVPAKFHARYSAKAKTYEYQIWNDPVRSPLRARDAYHVPYALDLVLMRRGAKLLTGRHDFRSFCASDDRVDRNTVRTIYRFQIKKEGPLLRFTVEANGFLYHMVRNLVGTLLEVGRGKVALPELRLILKSRDRKRAGATVPAVGLRLKHVTY